MFLWCHGAEPLRRQAGRGASDESCSSADAFPMTSATVLGPAYIIAARRTALGRPGGLHRSRRLESLTAPVVLAALEDARLEAAAVEEIIFGNTTAGGNPARIVGLAAGLSDSVPALTVDRQCASGLDAILLGMRAVALGEARVVVAGGGESLSTAPWRVARPKSPFQTPRFIGLEPEDGETADTPHSVTASEASGPAARHQPRPAGCLCAALAPEGRAGHERASLPARDRAAAHVRRGDARSRASTCATSRTSPELAPIMPPDGTHTSGNISALQEGAAVVVIVSAEVSCRARPPARLAAGRQRHAGRRRQRGSARSGRGAREAAAHQQRLHPRPAGAGRDVRDVRRAGAGGARCLRPRRARAQSRRRRAGARLSAGRGQRRQRGAAVHAPDPAPQNGRLPYGAVTQGAIGGLGVAALFEAVC